MKNKKEHFMKTIGFIIRFLFVMIGAFSMSAIATFFLSVFKLEDVKNAVDFFKNFF